MLQNFLHPRAPYACPPTLAACPHTVLRDRAFIGTPLTPDYYTTGVSNSDVLVLGSWQGQTIGSTCNLLGRIGRSNESIGGLSDANLRVAKWTGSLPVAKVRLHSMHVTVAALPPSSGLFGKAQWYICATATPLSLSTTRTWQSVKDFARGRNECHTFSSAELQQAPKHFTLRPADVLEYEQMVAIDTEPGLGASWLARDAFGSIIICSDNTGSATSAGVDSKLTVQVHTTWSVMYEVDDTLNATHSIHKAYGPGAVVSAAGSLLRAGGQIIEHAAEVAAVGTGVAGMVARGMRMLPAVVG